MKIKVFSLLIVLLLVACAGTRHEKKIITGKFSWNQWQQQTGWNSYDAADYEPGEFLAEQLSNIVSSDSIDFLLFSGSWCGDSESEVPKIYKLFQVAKIPLTKITLYGVDRQKLEPTGTAKKYEIQRVPTLIILSKGKEKGRIIEYPKVSWEEDIFKTLIKK